MKYNLKAKIGWMLITIALGMSAYANFECSFGCQGIYAQVLNPMTIVGLINYAAGTYLIFSKCEKE